METISLKIEAYGVKGMDSKPWRRTFPNQAAMEKWLEKTGAELQGVRDVEG